MSRLFSSIVFSLFLLFQTTSLAEEDTPPEQINVEAQEDEAAEGEPKEEISEEIAPVEQETQPEVAEEVEPKEEMSEAEKEALAAEEAELREAGIGEEPVPE